MELNIEARGMLNALSLDTGTVTLAGLYKHPHAC